MKSSGGSCLKRFTVSQDFFCVLCFSIFMLESLLSGEMAEWSNAPDSKSGIRLYRIVGSNPTLSAIPLSHKPSLTVIEYLECQ